MNYAEGLVENKDMWVCLGCHTHNFKHSINGNSTNMCSQCLKFREIFTNTEVLRLALDGQSI
jgi:hypothetical protein